MAGRLLHTITDTDRRGAQVFAAELSEALRRRNRPVDTVALRPGRRGGIDAEVLGATRLGPATLRALRRRIAGSEVVVGFGSATLPACAVAGLGTAAGFVYRSIGEIGYWANTPARRARVRLFLRRADAVVVLWPEAAEGLVELGVPRSSIRVIPRGVPAGRFPVAGPAARLAGRRRFGLDPDRPTLVYLGSLTPEKRVEALIDSLRELPEHQLLVAGDGPEHPALSARAQVVAPGRVSFAGAVDDPPAALTAGDVLVLASRSEGMPGAVIEGSLSGLPVVAPRVGAVPELVLDGVTGRIVERDPHPEAIAAAVTEALDNAGRWGQAARAHALERFEIERVADAWEQLVDEVAARERRGRLRTRRHGR